MKVYRHRPFMLAPALVVFLSLIPFAFGGQRGSLMQRIFDSSDDEPFDAGASSSTAPDRRIGGIRQRIQPDPPPPRTEPLPLNNDLRRDWGKGVLRSTQVQQYAQSARAQGASGVDRFASIGAGGKFGGNLFRDLKSLFKFPDGCAPIEWIVLPTIAGRKAPHPVMCPHRFFQEVFSHRSEVWRQRIEGIEGSAFDYWNDMKESEFVKQHTHLPQDIWAKAIPVGMHGDGGAFNKHDQVYAFSWNSLLSSGTTLQTKFLFSVIRKSDAVADSIDVLLKHFAWSMNVLLTGETPYVGPNGEELLGGGQPLCGDWRGCLAQCRGDWQFYCQVSYFPQWHCNLHMCPFCRASNVVDGFLWTDCTDGAGWRLTKWSHDAYIHYLNCNGLPIPVLFLIAIGFRLCCVMIDSLHTVDQGIASHIVGSALWYVTVIRGKLGGGTLAAKVELLNKRLKQYYSQESCQKKSRLQGKLTVERLRNNKLWPKLKAKAAATRHLAAFALQLILEFSDVHDPHWGHHDTLATGVCQLLCRYYTLLDSESMFFSTEAKTEIHDFGNLMGNLYTQLSNIGFAFHVKLWKMSPKLHLFMHLCIDQSPLMGNPRSFYTYSDEDLIGQLIDIAKGVHPSTVAISVLFKWAVCVWSDLFLDID